MNDALICVSLCAGNIEQLKQQISAGEAYADAFEIRFDCLDQNAWNAVKDAVSSVSSKPVLATLRTEAQGGARAGVGKEDLAEFVRSADGKFWAVDVEDLDINGNSSLFISSFHDHARVPADLSATVRQLTNNDSAVIKIAVTAADATDAIPVFLMLADESLSSRRLIPIAMGDAGRWLRILGPAHGAFLTFASIDSADATAPGQVTAKDLTETYRVKKLSKATRVFGVLGDPISQSLSPYMHNPAFAAAGEDAVFISFLVKDIGRFMQRMVRRESREVELNFGGFSVTMPHKLSIMKHLDEIDDTAAAVGAVNTVEIDGDRLIGRNTDAEGFITPLKKRFGDLRGMRVAVCGAGGAARACLFSLKKEGADAEIFVRDVRKAERLAYEFGFVVRSIDELRRGVVDPKSVVFDILVDATPIGMGGAMDTEALLTADELKGVRFVYDLVTKAADTPIIREAKAAGIPAIGGIEMLLAQGARQFAIWTHQEAPVDLMRQSLLERIK